MSLVKSRELFAESALPVTVDTVVDRTLIQKELHRHEYFEMLYVEQGELLNRFKSEEVALRAGDLLIMKPYVRHVLIDSRTAGGKALRAYCCSFLPKTVDSGIQSLEELTASQSPNRYFFRAFLPLTEQGVSALQIKIDADLRPRFVACFERLKGTTHTTTEKSLALTRCHFLELLTLIGEQHEREPAATATIQTNLTVPVSRYQVGLRKTLTYIHDHYDQPLTLDQMAAMCGASGTYFCRLFKHETGMTFLNYLNGLRIEQACILLRDTCDSALDICYRVGFNDYTHFGRQFRKNTGMSPADFRKQKRHVRRIRES